MGCSDSKADGAGPESPREGAAPNDKGNRPDSKAESVSVSITSPRHSSDDFAQIALQEHNSFRTIHQVDPLVLSDDLCELSERFCQHLVRAKTFCNSNPEQRMCKDQECGENLYRHSGGKDEEVTAEMAVQSWYDEVDNYHSDLPGFDITTCHFTQMVWSGTKEMGIAHAYYDDEDGFRKSVVVAHYFPAGNVEGDFEHNVLIPEGLFNS